MRPLYSLIALLVVVGISTAAPPDFDRKVAPILTACLDCHTGADAQGGLDLSRRMTANEAIVPGDPATSPLWQRVVADEMPPKRPLTASDKAVLKAWIESGATWGSDPIDLLAHTTRSRAGRSWWSLQPVVRPTLPAGTATNPIDRFLLAELSRRGLPPNPEADRRTLIRRLKFDLLGLPPSPDEVDAFVRNLAPDAYEQVVDRYLVSPQFGERWARHWLDIVRYADSNGFEMNQPRPTAWPYRDWVIRAANADLPYDQFVFHQLAGDTVGQDAATGFLVAGPWDQVKSPDPVLTANQRADELHDLVGTVGATFIGLTVGCARCHDHKFDPITQADYYRLKAVFAGVQHGERVLRSPDSAMRAEQVRRTETELTKLETALTALHPLADPGATEPRRPTVSPRLNIERFTATPARFIRLVVSATNGLEPCIDEFEVFTAGADTKNVALTSAGAIVSSAGDYSGTPEKHRLVFVNDGRYGNGRSWISNTLGRGRLTIELPRTELIDRVVWSRDREGQFLDRLVTRYRIDVSVDGRAWQVVATSDDRATAGAPVGPPSVLTQVELTEWKRLSKQIEDLRRKLTELRKQGTAYVGRFTAPEPTFLLHRGDPTTPGGMVTPGVLSEVRPQLALSATTSDVERRVAFARWVTNPANPLTARVLVNRLWQQHFGTGLVSTPGDLGFNGSRPSHPELLDWLAAELMSRNWSMKQIHRLIVTSSAYRRSSAASAVGMASDASSRFLWRYPIRRLEAEAIRDEVLAVSGKLDLTAGGPGFDLFEPDSNYVRVYKPKEMFGPAEFRRMVYQHRPRMQLDDTFGVFDCPDGGQIAPRRNTSTTPLQTLNLLNSPFMIQQASYFAARVTRETTSSPAVQARHAFRLAFQREPSWRELDAATQLVIGHGLPALCRALLNANEFLYPV